MTSFLGAERGRPSGHSLLVLAFLTLGFAFPAQSALATSLTKTSGKVFYRESTSATWGEVTQGLVLKSGDQIRTDPGARATISFDDQSRVELGPTSSFTVQEAKPETHTMQLSLGSLRAWVTKRMNRQFQVRTPTAVCSVRGTEFEVGVNPEGNTNVQMFEGLLGVADLAGNEILLKENQRVDVTGKGLGPVESTGEQSGRDKAREAMKREVGLEMSKEEVQAAAAEEIKTAVYKEGKAIIDVTGNRVRIEEYIVRPQANQFKLVVLNDRVDRFDYFYYKGTFAQTLPDDLSTALRQLPGCIGAPCQFNLTDYETARSNTIDNMLEIAGGGHQVDVNNNGTACNATFSNCDAVFAAFDPATDKFVAIPVLAPGTNNPALNTPFYQTLFNTDRLTFNGIEHSRWAPSGSAPGGVIRNTFGDVTYTFTTSVQNPPGCGPPDCTYTEDGLLHQVVYASNATGTIWEKYDSYIISDEGKVAQTADFVGATSGTSYKSILLNWNFEMIVTASEFNGRKIDLAVEPKIFIQSGLIP